MKRMRLWIAAMLVLPALARPQGAPVQPRPDMNASFAAMKANVAKIVDPAEKERWQANVDAWQIEIAQTGAITKAKNDKLAASLRKIRRNVARVADPAEKERWQANIGLWQLLISHKGLLAKSDLATAKAFVETISNNVAKVTEPGEKERWTANRDMWQGLLDRSAVRLAD